MTQTQKRNTNSYSPIKNFTITIKTQYTLPRGFVLFLIFVFISKTPFWRLQPCQTRIFSSSFSYSSNLVLLKVFIYNLDQLLSFYVFSIFLYNIFCIFNATVISVFRAGFILPNFGDLKVWYLSSLCKQEREESIHLEGHSCSLEVRLFFSIKYRRSPDD